MSLYNVKISKKGQIIIAKELREKYNFDEEIEIILISTFKSILLKSKSRGLSQLQILFREIDFKEAAKLSIKSEAIDVYDE